MSDTVKVNLKKQVKAMNKVRAFISKFNDINSIVKLEIIREKYDEKGYHFTVEAKLMVENDKFLNSEVYEKGEACIYLSKEFYTVLQAIVKYDFGVLPKNNNNTATIFSIYPEYEED